MLTVIQGLAQSLDAYNPVVAFPTRRMRDNVSNYLGSDIERLLSQDWKIIYNPDLVAATHVLSRFSLLDRLADAFLSDTLPEIIPAPRRVLPAAASQKLRRVGCCPPLC